MQPDHDQHKKNIAEPILLSETLVVSCGGLPDCISASHLGESKTKLKTLSPEAARLK